MYCTNCGKRMEEQARFCTNCGAPAESDAPVENLQGNASQQKQSKTGTVLIGILAGTALMCIVLVLTVALTKCSGKEEPSAGGSSVNEGFSVTVAPMTEPVASEPVTEPSETEVAKDLTKLDTTMNYTVTNGKFSLTLPAYWKEYGAVFADEDSIALCEKSSTSTYGGKVVTFYMCPMDEVAFFRESFDVIGIIADAQGNQWGLAYYEATDVQFDAAAMDIYMRMTEDVEIIVNSAKAEKGYTLTKE